MKELTTIARPYASAVFKLAQEQDKLDVWSDMLAFLGAVTEDASMKGLIADPRVTKVQLADLLIDVAGGRITDEGKNLVRVLAENGRVPLTAEIARLYEEQRAAIQGRVQVELTAAFPVNAKYEQMIAKSMQERLGREVEITTTIDASLIGGVVIRAGDLVLDGSLSGRLKQLATELA